MTASGEPLHVTPYGSYWAIRRSDRGKPISQYVDLAVAVGVARRLAADLGVELVVFDHNWHVIRREFHLDE